MAIEHFLTQAPIIAMQTGWPSLWLAAPSTGKTQSFYSVARFFHADAIEAGRIPADTPLHHYAPDLVLSHYDPSDIGGIPWMAKDENGNTIQHRALPDYAKILAELGEGFVFCDEMLTATPSTQGAALKLINERKVGDIQLPDGVKIVAAANNTNVAGNFDLTAAASNRFWHSTFNIDFESWSSGFMGGFPDPEVKLLPEDWKTYVPELRALLVGFLRSKPDVLHVMPEEDSEQGHAWPSRRTWDMAADLLAAAKAYGAGEDVKAELLIGAVGEGAGYEALTYIQNIDLQDPEEILAEPAENLKLPDRGDQKFAILGSMTAAVERNLTDERWTKAWDILGEAVNQDATDVAVVQARTLVEVFFKAKADGRTLPPPHDQLNNFTEILQAAGLYGKKGQ